MSGELRLEKGRLLLQRRGGLNFLKQEMWDRAPEKKGMWAFPWPYEDTFFTWHQVTRHLPKALQREAFAAYAEEEDAIAREGSPEEFQEHRLRLQALREARDAWEKENARKVAPLRRFWWEGSLYAHFTREGEVLSLDEWSLITVQEYHRAFVKSRGVQVLKPRLEEDMAFWFPGAKYAQDHLEVFLSPRHGGFRGRA